jgi:hypothetical protein
MPTVEEKPRITEAAMKFVRHVTKHKLKSLCRDHRRNKDRPMLNEGNTESKLTMFGLQTKNGFVTLAECTYRFRKLMGNKRTPEEQLRYELVKTRSIAMTV